MIITVSTIVLLLLMLLLLLDCSTDGRGVWEWDRLDLLRLPDLSLLQLLERIPGLTPVRLGVVGQPEGAAVFGSAAGAITYIVDGFRLDPMVSPTFDPSRIPLLALGRVRVERRVTGATVRIDSLDPDDPRTESIIEAATGDFNTNLFRGMFLAPRLLAGSVGLGCERLGTDGFRGANAAQTGAWLDDNGADWSAPWAALRCAAAVVSVATSSALVRWKSRMSVIEARDTTVRRRRPATATRWPRSLGSRAARRTARRPPASADGAACAAVRRPPRGTRPRRS